MKKALKIIGIVILLVVVIGGFYFYVGLPDVSDLKTKNPRSTALMVQRYREAKKNAAIFRIRQKWVDFEAIPKLLQETVRVTPGAPAPSPNNWQKTCIFPPTKASSAKSRNY
jgi:membrane peptidoglycan carboxypeptidase